MGHIYYRQEKYGMAEYHFRRALQVGQTCWPAGEWQGPACAAALGMCTGL